MSDWRQVYQVKTFLDAHRREMRPLAVVRCPKPPSPVLAAVYIVNGARWLWAVGDKLTPAELEAQEIDAEEWLTVASTVTPLGTYRRHTDNQLDTCRKCRLTYEIDVRALDAASEALPSNTVTLPAATR